MSRARSRVSHGPGLAARNPAVALGGLSLASRSPNPVVRSTNLASRSPAVALRSLSLASRDPAVLFRNPAFVPCRSPAMAFRNPGLASRDPSLTACDPGLAPCRDSAMAFRSPSLTCRNQGLAACDPGLTACRDPVMAFRSPSLTCRNQGLASRNQGLGNRVRPLRSMSSLPSRLAITPTPRLWKAATLHGLRWRRTPHWRPWIRPPSIGLKTMRRLAGPALPAQSLHLRHPARAWRRLPPIRRSAGWASRGRPWTWSGPRSTD